MVYQRPDALLYPSMDWMFYGTCLRLVAHHLSVYHKVDIVIRTFDFQSQVQVVVQCLVGRHHHIYGVLLHLVSPIYHVGVPSSHSLMVADKVVPYCCIW